jgi:hypothetical protein
VAIPGSPEVIHRRWVLKTKTEAEAEAETETEIEIENRRQEKTEDRRQKTEDRRQKETKQKGRCRKKCNGLFVIGFRT